MRVVVAPQLPRVECWHHDLVLPSALADVANDLLLARANVGLEKRISTEIDKTRELTHCFYLRR